jgi:hypothetical protein
MRTVDDVQRMLDSEPDRFRRGFYFAAMLSEAAGRDELVIVGGSAIEVYTAGAYASGDTDVVGNRDRVEAALKKWGFKKPGMGWIRDGWPFFIQFVGSKYTGSWARTRQLQTPYGRVRLAAVEDLIVKRLASAMSTGYQPDYRDAVLLASEFEGEIDWDYATETARRWHASELLERLRSELPADRQV